MLVNGLIGFVQEGKAERAIAALHQMLAPMASVLVDGERRTVDSESLVPGDIIVFDAGDKISADVRLLEARHLKIQEAILTGESVPVEKYLPPVAKNSEQDD